MTDGSETGIARAFAREGWYGLYDTQDRSWLGTDEGPVTYEREDIAMVSAAIVETQLRWEIGRVRAKIYDGTGTKKAGTENTHMSSLGALRRLEGYNDGSQ